MNTYSHAEAGNINRKYRSPGLSANGLKVAPCIQTCRPLASHGDDFHTTASLRVCEIGILKCGLP